MSIHFDVGFSIVCICLFLLFGILVLYTGGCEAIEEDIGLTARSSENTVVENPAHNV